jgi:hypothetical protein
MKLARLIFLAVVIVSTLDAGSASAEFKIRGYGTAAVNGVLTVNEWEGAGRSVFQTQGGPATFYVMNDAQNLYLALRAPDPHPGASVFDASFLTPPLNPFGEGNDILRVTPGAFEDLFIRQISPTYGDYLPDVADGGTRDGQAVVRSGDGEVVYEIAKPLNSADDRHDFSLRVPSRIFFYGGFQSCLGCGGSGVLADPSSQIVVVSGTHVPPETTIMFGPADWAELSSRGQFGFVGVDDVAPPSELVYQCKIDERDWRECTSPIGSPISPLTTEDGWHTFSVRALDDMLNADPTPAMRFWRVDTQAPSKPKVVVSGRRGAARKELRISATDRGTPAGRLRFRCRVNTKPFRACGSRLRLRLPPGRHLFRVHAIDPAGNGSDVRIVRLVVR